jgi:hypothetical protein
VTRPVPHKCADPVAYFDTCTRQGVSKLMGSIPSFLIGLAANAIFRQRNDFFVGRDFGTSVQNVGHQ